MNKKWIFLRVFLYASFNLVSALQQRKLLSNSKSFELDSAIYNNDDIERFIRNCSTYNVCVNALIQSYDGAFFYETLLSHALYFRAIKIATYLLEHGADINLEGDRGTALIRIIKTKENYGEESLKDQLLFLVSAGADPSMPEIRDPLEVNSKNVYDYIHQYYGDNIREAVARHLGGIQGLAAICFGYYYTPGVALFNRNLNVDFCEDYFAQNNQRIYKKEEEACAKMGFVFSLES
jgi:hypothetical protein